MVARVRHGGGIPRGSIFIPIHWNDQFSSDARVGALVNPVVDPVSGEPSSSTPRCGWRIPRQLAWLRAQPAALPLDPLTYWTRVQGKAFQRYEFAGRDNVAERGARARALLGVVDDEADWIEYEDRSAGIYHAAHVVGERTESCLYVSTRPDLPSRAWMATLFGQDALEDADRIARCCWANHWKRAPMPDRPSAPASASGVTPSATRCAGTG